MAVLGRVKIPPNARLDLPDFMALDSYAAGDWKGFLESITGDVPYIIKGFQKTIVGLQASAVEVKIGRAHV